MENNELLEEALRLCHQGKLSDAKLIYEKLILTLPNNLTVLVNLGIIEIEAKNAQMAIDLFKKAIRINSSEAYIWANLGNAYLEAKHYKNALDSFDKALEINPNFINALYNKARCQKAQKNYTGAKDSYMKVIELEPKFIDAYINLGTIFYESKEYEKATKNYKLALSFSKNDVKIIYNLGLVHKKLGDYTQAISYFQEASKLDPNNIDILINLANIYVIIFEYKQALFFYNKIIEFDPNNYDAILGKSEILFNENNCSQAKEYLKKAIKISLDKPDAYSLLAAINIKEKDFKSAKNNLDISIKKDPNFSEAYNLFGLLSKYSLNDHESENFFKKSISLDSENEKAKFNLAEEYLSKLNFIEGWKYYESRYSKQILVKNFPYKNKKLINSINEINSFDPIYILGEQGIGDQILFLSLLSEFENFKNKIYVNIDLKLHKIFKENFKEITFLDHSEELNPNLYSYYLCSGSLGRLFRSTLSSFSKQKKFLNSCSIKKNYFLESFKSKSNILCGISWKSKNKDIGNDKSVDLNFLLPILKRESFKLIDLQYGDTLSERKLLQNQHNIYVERIDELDYFDDLHGLFSLIDACDIVLTVSNVTAHIAGALGKKTFLLVPFIHGKIWYWHNDLRKSLWYPSVNIYRQSKHGDWMPAIEQINKDLELI